MGLVPQVFHPSSPQEIFLMYSQLLCIRRSIHLQCPLMMPTGAVLRAQGANCRSKLPPSALTEHYRALHGKCAPTVPGEFATVLLHTLAVLLSVQVFPYWNLVLQEPYHLLYNSFFCLQKVLHDFGCVQGNSTMLHRGLRHSSVYFSSAFSRQTDFF